MKKCCYCHKDLQGGNGVTCEKCKANEAKYGKPGVCKYCQLPAAFLDEKCVHCSYAERKHGPPVTCSKCQLKCAFPKSPSLKNKSILCRLCMLAHGPSLPTITTSSASKSSLRKRTPSLSQRRNSNTLGTAAKNSILPAPLDASIASSSIITNTTTPVAAHSTTSANNAKKSRRDSFDHHVDTGAEHILTIQQLKDNILELTRTIQLRDKLIQEKDQKIAELNANLLRRDRDHRQKVIALEKRHTDMIGPLREQIKNLTRQIGQLQKLNKTSSSSTGSATVL